MEQEYKFQALLEQWKEINSFCNKIDTELWPIFTIIAAIYGAIITVYKGNIEPRALFDFKFWILIMLPIITAIIMGSLANSFRWVAVARMYLSALEKEINSHLDKNYYSWNSSIIDEYIGKQNGINRWIMPIIISFFFIVLITYLNINMCYSPLNSWIKVAYFLYSFGMFVIILVPFLNNGNIRKKPFDFSKAKINDNKPNNENEQVPIKKKRNKCLKKSKVRN